ncbi:universal stress protein [Ovoidimarina sediminis]|uniref:universal stress protein n=1 Tax=Ovoidimarina sediminis TaxID=3079856 RepID=UPI0039773A87
MYKKILIATDGSDLASRAVEHGLELAKSVGASVVILTVTQVWSSYAMASEAERGKPDAIQAFEDATTRAASRIHKAALGRAASIGVRSESRHLRDQNPAEGILETAELEGCDLIVVASHGHRGLRRMMMGSQTAEVIALSRRPVLVLR